MGRRSGLSATIAQDYGLSRAEHGSNERAAPLPDGTMAADAPAQSPCENEWIAAKASYVGLRAPSAQQARRLRNGRLLYRPRRRAVAPHLILRAGENLTKTKSSSTRAGHNDPGWFRQRKTGRWTHMNAAPIRSRFSAKQACRLSRH
jgi:hypothetical protein